MKNLFSALGFPPDLVLDPESIEAAWREATRQHNDRDSPSELTETDELADLHEARAVLGDPVRRLRHWLELAEVPVTRATSMDSGMMDLFGNVGNALSQTDDFLSRHESATTALAKALLTKEAISVQLQLQDQMQKIQAKKQEAIDGFPELENLAADGQHEEAVSTLQQLQFLAKWEAQCQERLLSLLSC